ncbi:MAG: peptidylprolyl isomerase [Dethiobacteria bacterium]
MTKKPQVTIEMESGNSIKVELYPEVAPNTVANFITLARQGFYDGLIFHRVIPGFMIQGGCPQGTGMGGPGYHIKGEFSQNGHPNPLRHKRGTISMARAQMPDSAGSQFFIMVEEAPHLDGLYASFGMVLEGMEEVDKIVNVKRDVRDKPIEDQKIKKITVETFGKEYDVVEKM